jgi:NADP-dependent 3-hydroxy acid dehydrogenase YdfG
LSRLIADDFNRNFAGIVGPLQNVWDTDLDQWRKVIEINEIGLLICNKHELKQMLKQDSIQVYVWSSPTINRSSSIRIQTLTAIQ